MPAGAGEQWNESETWRDAWTLRACRRLTTLGEINQTPNYHTNIGFTADGETLVFWTLRENQGAFCRVEVATGEITQLTEPAAVYGYCAPRPGRPLPAHVPGARQPLAGVHGRSARCTPSISTPWSSARSSPTQARGSSAIRAFRRMNSAFSCPLRRCIRKSPPGRASRAATASILRTGRACVCVWPARPWPAARRRTCGARMAVAVFTRSSRRRTTICCSSTGTFPPRYWSGSDGVTTRIWSLRIESGELTELPARNRDCHHVHAVWSFDGERVLYHGRNRPGPWLDPGRLLGGR